MGPPSRGNELQRQPLIGEPNLDSPGESLYSRKMGSGHPYDCLRASAMERIERHVVRRDLHVSVVIIPQAKSEVLEQEGLSSAKREKGECSCARPHGLQL